MSNIFSSTALPPVYVALANAVNFSAPHIGNLSIDHLVKDFSFKTLDTELTQALEGSTFHMSSLREVVATHLHALGFAGGVGFTTYLASAINNKLPGINRLPLSARRLISFGEGVVLSTAALYFLDPQKASAQLVAKTLAQIALTAIAVRASTSVGMFGLTTVQISSKAIANLIAGSCGLGITVLNGINLIGSSQNQQAAPLEQNNKRAPELPKPEDLAQQSNSKEKTAAPPRTPRIVTSPAKPPSDILLEPEDEEDALTDASDDELSVAFDTRSTEAQSEEGSELD